MNNNVSQLSTISSKNVVLFLIIIGIISFSIRMYFFPFDIPLVMDALMYFWYANDISVMGTFPEGYDLVNNMWPTILSVFFTISDSNDYLDYMNIQKFLSVTFSILTIIPMYYLGRRFFGKAISILGCVFIAFAPRLILNSFLGITESLFVLLGTIIMWLFLSSNKKVIYIAFVTAAVFSLVRYEGVMIIIPMTILYILRFKNHPKVLPKYFLCIGIFILVLLPMSAVRMETMGYDGLFSHVNAGVSVMSEYNYSNEDPDKRKFFPDMAIISLIKNLGWSLVPLFIIFTPLGIFYFLKDMNFGKISLILFGVFLILPEFYAFGRGIQDSRYLLDLFPIFTIASLFTINQICKKIKRQNLVCLIIIVCIILTSFVVLSYKDNSEHQRESYNIALETKDVFSVINSHHPEDSYRRVIVIDNQKIFPLMQKDMDKKITVLSMDNISSVETLIKENRSNGLRHLVIDDNTLRPDFIKYIFENEDEFPYLIKIYDSKENNYKYGYKIFKIDFKEFEKNNP